VESIDNLICTLEILSSALSARDRDKAVEAITLLLQQITMTFGHATRVFLAILFLQTLKVHVLCEEFEEASGGALALLARLRAVNTAIKQSTAESAQSNFDASADDVLDDVMDAGITPRFLLPEVRVAVRKPPEPSTENLFATYPLMTLAEPSEQGQGMIFVGGFPRRAFKK
jgi:hypothetical protein